MEKKVTFFSFNYLILGRQYQLWNRDEKYFRNFFIINADPIELSCQTGRIPYLFNFSSNGVSEIYIEDMINPEHSCWEVNFDYRHEVFICNLFFHI